MNWTAVSMINWRLSTPVLTGVEWADVETDVELSVMSLDEDGLDALVGGLRRPLDEKALCRRAAVVDRFRISPFIFCS